MMIILVESSSNIQNGHHVMKCAERGWSADMMMRSMTQHKGHGTEGETGLMFSESTKPAVAPRQSSQ